MRLRLRNGLCCNLEILYVQGPEYRAHKHSLETAALQIAVFSRWKDHLIPTPPHYYDDFAATRLLLLFYW